MIMFGKYIMSANSDSSSFTNSYFRILFEMIITGEKIRVYMAHCNIVERMLCFFQFFIQNKNMEKNYLMKRLPQVKYSTELVPIIYALSSEEETDKLVKRVKQQS